MKQVSQVEDGNRQEPAPVRAPRQVSFFPSPLGQLTAAVNSGRRMQALTQLKDAINGSQRVQAMMRLGTEINSSTPMPVQRVQVNDDAELEREADVMGAMALTIQPKPASGSEGEESTGQTGSAQLKGTGPGPASAVVQRMKLTEDDEGKYFIVGIRRLVMRLISYADGRGTFALQGGLGTVNISEDQVLERYNPFGEQPEERVDFQHSHFPRSVLGSSTAEGRHDTRRFVSNLDITLGGGGLQQDNPLDLHLELRKGLGTGKKRASENQVHATISLIIRDEVGRQHVVRYRVPKTFKSGAPGLDTEQLIEFLLVQGIIGSAEDYQSELYSHSEQEMIIYLRNNLEELALQLIRVAGTGGSVAGILLDLVSIPNTVCNECHKSLESLFSPGSEWMTSFLGVLSFNGLFIGPHIQAIIRASAENVFKGAQVQYNDAVKQGSFESDVNVAATERGPLFLELVLPLEGLSEERQQLIGLLTSRAPDELGRRDLQLGAEFQIQARLGLRNPNPDLVGTRFSYGSRRFEITDMKGGVKVKLSGANAPENLRHLVANTFGQVIGINGNGMACYIRSIITGLARRGLVQNNQIENLVAAIQDHLEHLGLRFRGETIDAGGLAAAYVRDAIQQLVPGGPDVGINIVQWSPDQGQLTTFAANQGAVPITLFYTPGHFDLVNM